ncbi:hypothetical protein NG800_015185 [Epilithonimonas ginsengisoli]|uniref:DUF998 domain-containing protein n=1 Tax=Epilithonimonas ginsengisoli TaxID=1245592 RepID=A0ABU4JKR5_9FLAO|nr:MULTISPECIES: hypothetical protein [Chryseobacterium group]MBV6881263.1 hypothetical protein [Epilithonimonas sp. FP105]MDW8550270.1 hypothetical protein [Epilithonimonas ginsengisoli]
MKNISVINILCLIVSIGILFSVDPVVNWVFQHHFEKNILPFSPHAEFEMYFSESRISYDRNFMYGIWGFILSLFLLLIFLDFRLSYINDSNSPDRKRQLSIFMLRVFAYAFIFVAFPMNLLIFDKGSSAEMLSFSDKMILSSFILVMLNAGSLIPYLSQRNIAQFFKLKDVLIYNIGMIVCMLVLLYLGVSQYVAPAIAGLLSSFGFLKKMLDAWNHIDEYFDIKGKRIYEMF